jgi:hypothetical protein
MDKNCPQKHIQRARIMLLSRKGLAVADVARQAGVSRPAVWRWQARYAEAGVEALLRDKTPAGHGEVGDGNRGKDPGANLFRATEPGHALDQAGHGKGCRG